MWQVSNFLRRISTGWVVLLAVVVMILFMIFVLPDQARKAEEASGGAGSPDTSLIYSPQDLIDQAEAYGEDGRQAYVYARWTFDLAFPLVYGFFLITTISWLFARGFKPGSRWQLANLAPLLAVVFDLLENTATSIVMALFPEPANLAAWLAPIFTLIKWVFVYASFGLLVVGLVAAVLAGIRSRR